MKKKYLNHKLKHVTSVRGAYDKNGKWWHEDDIKTFTGGMIQMFFGINREKIKIVEKNVN